jgi:cold-inducible RNA-binding protein
MFERRVVVNIFVGNLSREVTEAQLREAFEPFGAVSKTSVVRGFGFVDMPNLQEALAAIQGMNRQELAGQPVDVTQAHTREDRSGGYYRSSSSYRPGGANRSAGPNRLRNGKRVTRRTR